MIEHYGGEFFESKRLIKHETDKAAKQSKTLSDKEARIVVRNKLLAVGLIKSASRKRYGGLIKTIREQFALGSENYPDTLEKAFTLLNTYERLNPIKKPAKKEVSDPNNSRKYAQKDMVPGVDGKIMADKVCYRCNKPGHIRPNCPEGVNKKGVQQLNDSDNHQNPVNTGEQNMQLGYVSDDEQMVDFATGMQCNQIGEQCTNKITGKISEAAQRIARSGRYGDTDILLDTGSPFSCIRNKKMLVGLKKVTTPLIGYTNGGNMVYKEKGHLPGFFQVWYNEKSMLNILAWSDVRKHYRITADTDKENAISVHMRDGSIIKFHEVSSGLYMYSMNKQYNGNKKVSGYSFLTLVKENKKCFLKGKFNKLK